MFSFKQYLVESDKVMYVYDSGEKEVTEVDTSDELAMQRFNNKYKFHSDSLYDVPDVKGVRVFHHEGRVIVTGTDPIAVAAEVENVH